MIASVCSLVCSCGVLLEVSAKHHFQPAQAPSCETITFSLGISFCQEGQR